MTLTEMINAGAVVPELELSRYPSVGGISFSEFFRSWFADRVTYTDDIGAFAVRWRLKVATVGAKWIPILSKYDDIINGFVTPSDNETEKVYAAPDGEPDTSFVTGMITRDRSGNGADDPARFIRIDEFRNFWDQMLGDFEPLFREVWIV